MAKLLQWFADIMPLSYITEAMQHIVKLPGWDGNFIRDLLVTAGFILVALLLGAVTLRRQE